MLLWPVQQVPNPLPRKKSNCHHAPPVQPAPLKPLWSNLVSTTEQKILESIFINQTPCLWSRKWSGPDCFGSSSSRYSCYLILACAFQAWPCQSADFFLLFICKEPFWIYPLLYLCVISQCSNTFVFNPSLTAAWETTESGLHCWHIKQEQSTSGSDFFWWHSRNSIARGVLQGNGDKTQHYIMPLSGCLGPGDLVWNTVFVIHNILRALELHWILDWQGWHRCISSKNLKPKSNYSQFGLNNSIN